MTGNRTNTHLRDLYKIADRNRSNYVNFDRFRGISSTLFACIDLLLFCDSQKIMLQAKLDSIMNLRSGTFFRNRQDSSNSVVSAHSATNNRPRFAGEAATWGSSSTASLTSRTSSSNTHNNNHRGNTQTPELDTRWLADLDQAALDHLMEGMCDEMGLDETKRQAIRSLPRDLKVKMLQQHRKIEAQPSHSPVKGLPISSSSSHIDKSTPEFFVHELNWFQTRQAHVLMAVSTANMIKCLVGLRVSLTSQPITWVKQFIALDGMSALLQIISDIHARSKRYKHLLICTIINRRERDQAIEHEIIRCIKVYMNNAVCPKTFG